MRKKLYKAASVMTAVTIAVSATPMVSMATTDNPEGQTATVAKGGILDKNEGTVTSNLGTVKENSGTVTN